MVDWLPSPRLLLFLFLTQSVGQAQRITQDALLMQYIERRINILEDRLAKCNQDIVKYVREFRDFKKEITVRVDNINSYKSEFRNDVENLGFRIERVERDIDYLETQQPPQTCVEMDEKLVEEQFKQAEEKKKGKLKMISDCDLMLTGIKSLKIVKRAGDVQGSWIKDPVKDSQRIYFLSGTDNNILSQFANIRAFTDGSYPQSGVSTVLPYGWRGTGHAVYNGFLYYHRNGTGNEIIKYDLRNQTVSDRMLLRGAGRVPAYQLTPYTLIDLAADEQGLWAIHADPDNGDIVVLTKIDHGSLAVEHSWDTACASAGAEAAFMICGTLYVVYNSQHGGRSRIQCVYDVTDVVTTEDLPVLYFPKRYGKHSMMHYNHRERQLYSWDDGYQTIYKLLTKNKPGL